MELRAYGPAESTGFAGLGSRLTAAVAQQIWNARSAMKSHPWFSRSEPKPGTGVLCAKIANGPKFGLHADTGRSYVLFEAGANDFCDTAWPERAPWIDEPMWPQSPSILWPDDHAWVLGTEIDFDSTLIAGSAALIQELVHTPGLEVLPISTDADLSWDGDTVNRRA